MSEQQQAIAPFYQGWQVYQGLIIKALAPLTPEQLELRAAPSLRTIERIAAHMVGARMRWFHDLMGEGGPEAVPLAALDRRGSGPHSAATLVQGLEASWLVIQGCLERWTPADLEFAYPGDPSEGEPEKLTRQWVLWHVLEHDLHHGGELSLTLGIHGLAAPDL